MVYSGILFGVRVGKYFNTLLLQGALHGMEALFRTAALAYSTLPTVLEPSPAGTTFRYSDDKHLGLPNAVGPKSRYSGIPLPQSDRRRQSRMNHPGLMFQLAGLYCTYPGALSL